MGRKRKGARVLGPYHEPRRDRWRVVQVDGQGQKTTHFAASPREAALLVKACRLDLGLGAAQADKTVGEAVEEFIDVHNREREWRPTTLRCRTDQLNRLFAGCMDEPVSAMGPARGPAILNAISYISLYNQRVHWAALKYWGGWAVRRGYIRACPTSRVAASDLPWAGRRRRHQMGRGKAQLAGKTAAEKYAAAALLEFDARCRVGALLPLLTGMRSGEIRHLQIGKVDLPGKTIWIEGDDDGQWSPKSASSHRTVLIPPLLYADLETLLADREPDLLLLPTRNGETPAHHGWLTRLVARVCERAGLPVVTPHGLRGTYASLLAAVQRRSAAEIGSMLGHADTGATARNHYIGVAEARPALSIVAGK